MSPGVSAENPDHSAVYRHAKGDIHVTATLDPHVHGTIQTLSSEQHAHGPGTERASPVIRATRL